MTSALNRRCAILIADDHQVLAEGLVATLGVHYHIVGQVQVLAQLPAAILQSRPDVAILDVSFQGVSALPMLREITSDPRVTTRFVVLTGIESGAVAAAAIEAGAVAFILKGSGIVELRTAIDAALLGERYYGVAHFGSSASMQVQPRKAGAMVDGFLLRPREVELLTLMLEGRTRIEAGRRMGITVKGVDYHLAALRERLGIPTARMLLRWAATNEASLKEAFVSVANPTEELRG